MGHQLYDCSAAFESGEDLDLSAGFPEDIWTHRMAVRAESGDWDEFGAIYGLPSIPIDIPLSPPFPPICAWGDSDGEWGRVLFTDAPGQFSSVPEATRC
eukprot:646196-Pyramimonas_sp.AAC.1